MIRKQHDSYVLKSHEGKVLGVHNSYADARRQETAINLSKARAAGHEIPPKPLHDKTK